MNCLISDTVTANWHFGVFCCCIHPTDGQTAIRCHYFPLLLSLY